ncbi:citrate lyase beta subunit [Rhodotorula diobovata]|uniref:Citrate lyase beta subunit n=1 Tax=Rhodotorula diobovata TaxID=5288 RepID=A0A5C5G1S5_9BASI|nr:citrate lyase beta subunit [Rhodotorula diobovata]
MLTHARPLELARPLSRLSRPPALRPPQRALLYVPGSSHKFLTKVLSGTGLAPEAQPDVVTLDLEDSVRTELKTEARKLVTSALDSAPASLKSRKFVRINSGRTGFDDLEAILSASSLDGLVLPKVHTAADLVAADAFVTAHGGERHKDLKFVASIESPLGLLNAREIAACSKRVGALLFAAEDYCASSRLVRTPSRRELLFARSSVVAVAHAHGLDAVDLVCVRYGGEGAQRELEDECREGREMGFTGKQAIHPAQVETIQRAFSPSPAEIERAQRILAQYDAAARDAGRGAYGLVGEDGSVEMMDAPMLLQAKSVLEQARAAGVDV